MRLHGAGDSLYHRRPRGAPHRGAPEALPRRLGAPLDKSRLTFIGHEDLELWNPISGDLLDDWIREFPLDRDSRVLDVGCGRGEFLIRTVERFGCSGIGVDQLGPAIERARAETGRRIPHAAIDFRCEPFAADRFPPKSFHLVACLGATHAVKDLEAALRVLSRLAIPGGLLLVADGYWRRQPDPEYLAFLGATPEELRTHEGNLALARGLGLSVVRSHQATGAEWSHYEDTYAESLMRFVTGHPEDPDAREMGDWIQAWRHAYLRWGRDTLGFALYLLRR